MWIVCETTDDDSVKYAVIYMSEAEAISASLNRTPTTEHVVRVFRQVGKVQQSFTMED